MLKKVLILFQHWPKKMYLKENNTFCKHMQNISDNISNEYGYQSKSYLVLNILIWLIVSGHNLWIYKRNWHKKQSLQLKTEQHNGTNKHAIQFRALGYCMNSYRVHCFQDVEGSSHCLIYGIIPAFRYRNWGKPCKTSNSIASLQAKNLTRDLPNTKYECSAATFSSQVVSSHVTSNQKHIFICCFSPVCFPFRLLS